MIRTVLGLIPAEQGRQVRSYLVLTTISVLLRGGGVVLLVPLVAALFTAAPSDALPWLAVLTGSTILGWWVDARAARVGYGLGFGLLDDAQHSMADRLARVPLGWFTAERTASARQAIATTGPELVGLFGYLIAPLVQALLLPVVIGLVLLPLAWPIGLAALAGVPLLLGALWAGGRISARADRTADAANSVLTERIVEFARTQQALRAARRAEPARSQAGAALAGQHAATMRLLALQVPGQLLFSLATQAALVLLAGTTTWLALRGDIAVPAAIALIVVIARYLEPFAALGELAPALEKTRITLGRIAAVLDAPVRQNPTEDVALPAGAPSIGFEKVSFSYADDAAPVLTDFTVRFEPGTTTAIVGPSGSGKSTVLALAAGLREASSGTVWVDEAATSAAQRAQLSSVVFQHPYLFAGTVAENVRAGHPGATAEQEQAAMAKARVDELTARLPDGVYTVVGEGGTFLSGGERQRVSIARALLKPAPILLIDEATSALDAENERAVAAAVTAGERAQTALVVAHRLSTIRGADRVLFLDRGTIVEDGGVDELLAAGGRFAQFWHQQQEASGWRLAARA